MIRYFRKNLNRWKEYKDSVRMNHPSRIKTLEWFETLLGAFIIAMILRQFVVQSSLVFSGSMIPTLRSASQNNQADRLIVNKLIYKFNEPSRGDIVLFNSPYKDKKQYVKRLIGFPNETIEIRRGMVYINDKILIIP